MKYKLRNNDESEGVYDNETEAFIPNDGRNRHWREYTQWKLGLDIDGDILPGNPGVQSADSQFDLQELKTNKKDALKEACNLALSSGFTSNATGTSYTYESSIRDQLNISGAAQANKPLNFTVVDGGNKIRVLHTASQMKQVFGDGVDVIQAASDALYSLYNDVDNAVDEAAVNAIVFAV